MPSARGESVVPESEQVDRSPVDLALTSNERWLFAVNQTSNTVSLVDVGSGRVVDEVACGRHPSSLALSPDDRRLFVTGTYSGTLDAFDISEGKLKPAGSVKVGFEPVGVAVSPDGRFAYVALQAAGAVAVVDLETLTVDGRIEVARWPRYLALTPDGSRLAVGTSGDQSISVVDTKTRTMDFDEPIQGINIGHLITSADGKYAYFPWMVYRLNPITHRNIQAGWVLGSRIARVRLDEASRREAMTLDPRGKAVSDPHGIGMTRDEAWMVASGSGTHELLVYRTKGLVLQSTGGPGDHIDPELAFDERRFYRVELGGRPMGLKVSRDNRRVFVANYLANAVQVVDLDARAVVQSIDLGGPQEPSLARQGEAIFYDGRRSLDQWFSCHSCHYEGTTNAVAMDTLNDGSLQTFKTVLSLKNVTKTPPWTWHGWQTDLEAAMKKSLTETMLGPRPTDEDVRAIVAYLSSADSPPNPYRAAECELSPAAARGKAVFESETAGCIDCHNGPYFTDGEIHDVGLGSPRDEYEGYNTPSLVGVYQRVRLLHDGRGKSLEKALSGPHNPAKVTGRGELSEAELADLIEYLKTL
ncbi:MAG TPA: beta-propeller fold lactonase family protein [Pirellulales bacterium]|nr:beta-propeller fold lactonase family protein [Pirellulales bacterium]